MENASIKPLQWDGLTGKQGHLVYTVAEPNRTPGWRVWVNIVDVRNLLATIGSVIVTMGAADEAAAKAAAEADYALRVTALCTAHQEPQAMESAPQNRPILVWWPIVTVDDETGDLTDIEVDGRWLVTEWNGGCWLEPDVLNGLNSNYFDDDCEYTRAPKCWRDLPANLSLRGA